MPPKWTKALHALPGFLVLMTTLNLLVFTTIIQLIDMLKRIKGEQRIPQAEERVMCKFSRKEEA